MFFSVQMADLLEILLFTSVAWQWFYTVVQVWFESVTGDWDGRFRLSVIAPRLLSQVGNCKVADRQREPGVSQTP